MSEFAALHESGTFIMPNAWDVGSARLFESAGFAAIATTSAGFAGTLGRQDQNLTLDELASHVAAIASAIAIPLSVDSEDGYADDADGLTRTVEILADSGAAGVSIEDYRPAHGILDLPVAAERVGTFAEAAHSRGLLVTARAENHLYGFDDLDDTIERLRAYVRSGADFVYAPGLVTAADFGQIVAAVEAPLNALLIPGGPSVAELREVGVRRISTGGALTWVAYGAAMRAVRELLETGTQGYSTGVLSWDERQAAFRG